MSQSDSDMVCETHNVKTLPDGYDSCPKCQMEQSREAQLEHRLTRDPTLEPY